MILILFALRSPYAATSPGKSSSPVIVVEVNPSLSRTSYVKQYKL